MKFLRRERPLVSLLVLGALVRIVWMRHAAKPAITLNDPLSYQIIAISVAKGAGYGTFTTQNTAYYPPGYPGSLGLFFWLLDRTPWTIKPHVAVAMFNFLPSVAVVLFTYLIARALYGSRVAFVAGLLVALWPNLVFHSAVALSETLFIAVFLAAIWVLVSRPWEPRPSYPRLAVAGALIGASALVRPLTLAWLPLLFLVFHTTLRSWRRSLAAAAVVTVAAGVVILPWCVRNTLMLHTPVLISTNAGDDLCIGNNPHATGDFRLIPPCVRSRAKSEATRDRENRNEAIHYALHHPGREVQLLFLKAYYTVRDDHDALTATEGYLSNNPLSHRNAYRNMFATLADAWWFAALAFAAFVPFQRPRRPFDARRRFFVIAGLLLAAAPLVFFGWTRFKVPLVPFLAVAAALTIVRLIEPAPNGASS